MTVKFNDQVKVLTNQVISEYYRTGKEFAAELSGMIPGLSFSPQIVYAWMQGQKPAYSTMLAVLYAAERVGNVRVAQWAVDILDVLQPGYWK